MSDIINTLKNNTTNYHIFNSNFRDNYKEIEENIKKAAVISIDSEFSGLTFSSKYKNSLFDKGPERYEILKKNCENFIIVQFGLTTFHFNRDDNKYEARMYNFYIFPRSVGTIDNRFSCQASSLHFLSKCSFDFNKFVYEGIPYLNEEQASLLMKELSDDKLFQQVDRNMPLEDEKTIQKVVSDVSIWALKAKIGEEFIVENDMFKENILLVYLIHKEIRRRFKELWSLSLALSSGHE